MTRAEALARLREMRGYVARSASAELYLGPQGGPQQANANALALAIRALELLGEVAACPFSERGSPGIGSRPLPVCPIVPRATWDAVREVCNG